MKRRLTLLLVSAGLLLVAVSCDRGQTQVAQGEGVSYSKSEAGPSQAPPPFEATLLVAIPADRKSVV